MLNFQGLEFFILRLIYYPALILYYHQSYAMSIWVYLPFVFSIEYKEFLILNFKL